MDLDLSKLGGQFSGARMGHCRVCRDCTVLPSFGDGRCFGCTSDELGETEWVAQRRILIRDSETLSVGAEVLEIFEEAQRSVPAFKIVAGMLGPKGSVSIRRHSLWVAHRRSWGFPTPRALIAQGLRPNEAVATYYRNIRSARQADGLCGACSEPAADGEKLCKKHQERLRVRYSLWVKAGLCGGCGRHRVPGKSACAICLQVRNETRRTQNEKNKSRQRCLACLKPALNGVLCNDCATKRARSKREARAATRLLHRDRGDGRTFCGRRILPARMCQARDVDATKISHSADASGLCARCTT